MEVAILALPRTGSSLLAGILHDSGVPMGKDFQEPNDNNPTGFFEDRRLKRVLKLRHNRRFGDYIRHRQSLDDIWGMKDPEMCGRIHTIEDECEDLRVIHLKRPITHSLESLKEYFHNAEESLIELNKLKHEDLRELEAPILEVEFYDLVDNPEETYQKVCDFLDIEPNWEALDRIDKKHVRHRVTM